MVIVLGSGEELLKSTIICLIRAGIKKFILIGTKENENVIVSRYCHRYYKVTVEEIESLKDSILKLIINICREDNCSIVIPACLFSAYYLSKYKSQIEKFIKVFPISNLKNLQLLHDKWEFALLLKSLLIDMPKTTLVKALPENPPMDLPVITKPVNGGGGDNVKLVCDHESYQLILNQYGSPFLMQEFIPGYDVDLSVISLNGNIYAWTIQRFINNILTFEVNKTILEIGNKIIRATNFTGLAHFDMRYDERDDSIKVLECNPRVWASIPSSADVGVNFIKLGIDIATSKKINFTQVKHGTMQLTKKTFFMKTLKGTATIDDFAVALKKKPLFLLDPLYMLYFHSPSIGKYLMKKFKAKVYTPFYFYPNQLE